MTLPNKFEVIGKDQLPRIHEATIHLLAETGIAIHHPEAISIFKKHGARVDGDIVRLPGKMVEACMQTVPDKVQWTARNEANSRILGQGFLVQPIAGPVHVQDLDHGRRAGTLADIANFQKIYQAGAVYDLVGMIAVEPQDIPQKEKHLHLMHEILRHTDKPVNGFMTAGPHARSQLDMMEIAMGGGTILDNHHCIAVSVGAISPLTWSWDATETLIQFARRNQIVTVLCAPLAGVTAPLSFMGTAVLQNAELLAGIILSQLVNPGTPAVYCPSATAADMRTGGYITGTPEGIIINTINYQMGLDFYHIPVRAMPGLTDSKTVDYQAGFETMQNLMMAMLAGAHLLNESVGVLDNILTVSYEKTIIDGELIERVKRIVKGIDSAFDLDPCLDAIRDIGPGGTYLLHPATVEHCRDRWAPSISYFGDYNQWEKNGSEDIVVRANRKFKEILESAPEMLIDPDTDRALQNYIQRELA